ncbi:band 7 protein [Thalassoporum mexicanum PCC 7367]|uniref:SPFH domain-containing protein n=1 Tax=Thalassoporum mexicanum TaxID=3457544 RepID=UPI00029FC1C2|nr:SPFH domain-containing protein [Pseudanabaena sp. PCC 7367]AFY71697.1 band 7 protein [Pseudanabaena sp. PCC 7367]
MPQFLFIFTFLLFSSGFFLSSIKFIDEDKQALVTRFGKYIRTLEPGVNFVMPVVDKIDFETRIVDQVYDIPRQEVITADNVDITIDAAIYWRIEDLAKVSFEVEDVKQAIEIIATATLRKVIANMTFRQTYAAQDQISDEVIKQLKGRSDDWGVEIFQVAITEVTPQSRDEVIRAIEDLDVAKNQSTAKRTRSQADMDVAIYLAKGEAESARLLAQANHDVQLLNAQAARESIKEVADVFAKHDNSQLAMQYLLAQEYINMGKKIGESPSAKVLFMDPNSIPGTIQAMLSMAGQPASNNVLEPSVQPFGAIGNLGSLDQSLRSAMPSMVDSPVNTEQSRSSQAPTNAPENADQASDDDGENNQSANT